jgi:HEPN domain-containing protein
MDEVTRTVVQRWLSKAWNDLRTAQTMIAVTSPPADTVCFHAQQCVEKCLKAFLTAANRHVEKTHDLTRLVELCSQVDQDFQRLRDIAVQLADYAVTGRYPDDSQDLSPEEAVTAAQLADEAMRFTRQKLGMGEPLDKPQGYP